MLLTQNSCCLLDLLTPQKMQSEQPGWIDQRACLTSVFFKCALQTSHKNENGPGSAGPEYVNTLVDLLSVLLWSLTVCTCVCYRHTHSESRCRGFSHEAPRALISCWWGGNTSDAKRARQCKLPRQNVRRHHEVCICGWCDATVFYSSNRQLQARLANEPSAIMGSGSCLCDRSQRAETGSGFKRHDSSTFQFSRWQVQLPPSCSCHNRGAARLDSGLHCCLMAEGCEFGSLPCPVVGVQICPSGENVHYLDWRLL